jgi:hypothetical protein
MPLQRQNPRGLAAAPTPTASGETLDELLGPRCSRPGELHHPAPIAVPDELRAAARAIGLATSVAVAVVAERVLVRNDVGASDHVGALLDAAAAATPRVVLSPASASYARTLMAALNGGSREDGENDTAPVVPARLVDRLRATPDLVLVPTTLRSALVWELASVRCGRTMTEWALGELLAARYPESASRQDVAAASAAR